MHYNAMVGTQSQMYVVIPQYSPLTLYTKPKGMSFANWIFYFPWYDLLMILKVIATLGLYVNLPKYLWNWFVAIM